MFQHQQGSFQSLEILLNDIYSEYLEITNHLMNWGSFFYLMQTLALSKLLALVCGTPNSVCVCGGGGLWLFHLPVGPFFSYWVAFSSLDVWVCA